jgi:hypothetical protein
MSMQLNRPVSHRTRGVLFPTAIPSTRAAVRPNPRQRLVRLALLLFLALLVEGIIRKWVFPGYHMYFYFLRDPLLLVFYFKALKVIPKTRWFTVWMLAACFISAISLIVFTFSDISPGLWVLGVRNYFMYIPLAFIVARVFERDDIERFAKLTAVLAVPIAIVCIDQFYSPPGGWINVGAGGKPPPVFAADLLRTTGVLASDAQHISYVLFTLTLLAAALVSDKLSTRTRFVVTAGGVATIAMMIVSGSRGLWFQAAGIGVVAMSSFFIGRVGLATKLRGVVVCLMAALLIGGLFSTVFGGAYQAYEDRNIAAHTFSYSGSGFSVATTDRIFSAFLPTSMFDATIVGVGIGMGTTGASAVQGIESWAALTVAENDLDRNFLELGLVLGWIFVALRLTFALWLVWISLLAARKGDVTALLLSSFSALAIFQSQITMHTTYAHLAWFAAGLTMAAARSAQAPRLFGTEHMRATPALRGRLERAF